MRVGLRVFGCFRVGAVDLGRFRALVGFGDVSGVRVAVEGPS